MQWNYCQSRSKFFNLPKFSLTAAIDCRQLWLRLSWRCYTTKGTDATPDWKIWSFQKKTLSCGRPLRHHHKTAVSHRDNLEPHQSRPHGRKAPPPWYVTKLWHVVVELGCCLIGCLEMFGRGFCSVCEWVFCSLREKGVHGKQPFCVCWASEVFVGTFVFK